MFYNYKGITKTGIKVKAKIEADDLAQAKAKLKAKGVIYTHLAPVEFEFGSLKFTKKIKPIELSNISRDISLYLKAGISLLNSLRLIKNRYKQNKEIVTFLESIIAHIDEGKNFHTALESQKTFKIPPFYIQSIKVSEKGGLLDSVLIELATFIKEQEKIKKQSISSVVYPVFILVVSFLMVGFMLSFVVPKITSIFSQLNQELPAITKFTIASGEFMQSYFGYIFSLLLLGLAGFSYLMKKNKAVRYAFDGFILKIPILKTIIEYSELSRFAYMNSILIKSGVPVVQSFNLASGILKNSVIQKLFLDATSKVVEGKTLSKMLENSSIYKIDEAFIQSVAIGEQTSQLTQILSNLAQVYNESNKDKIALFLSLLEPLAMLLVGGVIGFIVVSMLLPIFSMSVG